MNKKKSIWSGVSVLIAAVLAIVSPASSHVKRASAVLHSYNLYCKSFWGNLPLPKRVVLAAETRLFFSKKHRRALSDGRGLFCFHARKALRRIRQPAVHKRPPCFLLSEKARGQQLSAYPTL